MRTRVTFTHTYAKSIPLVEYVGYAVFIHLRACIWVGVQVEGEGLADALNQLQQQVCTALILNLHRAYKDTRTSHGKQTAPHHTLQQYKEYTYIYQQYKAHIVL